MAISAENWKQVQAIFAEAVEKPPADRSAFLDQACGGDAELRANVEALLRHDSEAGEDFLRPVVPLAGRMLGEISDSPDPLLGQRIGRYRIQRVINAGGMGTVYLAEQDNPRRDVALKVMKEGVFTTRSALRRFEYESQILARLRHPNIAQVYEAGTEEISYQRSALSDRLEQESNGPRAPTGKDSLDRGCEKGFSHQRQFSHQRTHTIRVPYFAMEYVPEARSITQYAREENLGIRERLALFLQVCDAVHHGHQKGIIHRDLKPANILVASDESNQRSAVSNQAEEANHEQSRARKEAVFDPNRDQGEAARTAASRQPLPYGRGSDQRRLSTQHSTLVSSKSSTLAWRGRPTRTLP